MNGDHVYCPGVFDVDSLARAKWVALNPDGVRDENERWEVETPYLIDRMGEWMRLGDSSVLDWGCGPGRLSKALIERHGCAVLGVDISSSMRRLAVEYVASTGFLCCDPHAMRTISRFGAQFDFAVSSWVLQHSADPAGDVDQIKSALRPRGRLFVLNAIRRFVPMSRDGQNWWIDDDVDVWGLLQKEFVALTMQRPGSDIIPVDGMLWGVFEKPSR